MNRRTFIRAGIAGSILTAAETSGCASVVPSQESPSGPVPFILEEATIAELRDALNSRRRTARSIVEAYLKRIAELDKTGPALRSVIETNPDALSIADALDDELSRSGPRGPLHGIPILVKDNIGTADRMTTTAGSFALQGSIPPRDSFVARRLREAGAIILGKSNLSEWANIRSTRSSSGWSARGGQCRNPYALDRNPCGSSSGSGVATAANLCAAAIGTETDGSIVCPATSNGIVGIKPTVGLISRRGIIPISHSQDTAGPMARCVSDAAALLGALAGPDPDDAATSLGDGRTFTDYTQFLDVDGLRGARIGVARNFFGFHAGVDGLMDEAIQAMKSAGAVIIDSANIATHGQFERAEFQVLLYEFKAGLNAYLADLGAAAPVKTLREVIDFNERNRDVEMPYFGQDIFLAAQEKGPLTSLEYLAALELKNRLSRQEGVDAVMDKYSLDAIIAPTGGPSWTTDLVNGDRFSGGSSSPAAAAGYPNITVPCGFVRDLPIGISFFGRAWTEPVLIRIAFAYEQTTKQRRPPGFRPTAA